MTTLTVSQQTEPDAESIAEVVRERYMWLTRRSHQSTIKELDEIVRLHRLLCAHIVYIQPERQGLA